MINESDSMEFTGERYIPGLRGIIELEHLHRYLQAQEIAIHKIVLDIACGEGYGSAMLANKAEKVIGIDISLEAVQHARRKYLKENLEFMVGSCSEIPLPDSSVDLVVSFETIEHHSQHDEMMLEIKRVLRPEGVIIISSPDKYNYSIEPRFKNDYHEKELYQHEFISLIDKYFTNSCYYGQRIVYGSGITSYSSLINPFYNYWREGSIFKNTKGISKPIYWIAIASDSALPEIPTGMFEEPIEESENFILLKNEKEKQISLLDQELINVKQNIECLNSSLEELNNTLIEKNKVILDQQNNLTEYDDKIHFLNQNLGENQTHIEILANTIAEKNGLMDSLNRTLDEKGKEINSLHKNIEDLDAQIISINQLSSEQQSQINTVNKALSERDERIVALNEELSEQNKKLELSKQTIFQRDEVISSVNQIISEQEIQIADRDAIIADRDAKIVERDAIIVERDAIIVERDAIIAERDAIIANRDSIIADRETTIVYQNNLILERDSLVQTKNLILAEQKAQIDYLNLKVIELGEQLTSLNHSTTELKGQIIFLEHSLADREKQVEQLNTTVITRDENIFILNNSLNEKEEHVNSINHRLLEKNLLIESLEKTIEEYCSLIDDLKSQLFNLNLNLTERDAQIITLNNTLIERDNYFISEKNTTYDIQGELASINGYLRKMQAPFRLTARYILCLFHPFKSYKLFRDIRIIKSSKLFDIDYYLTNNIDIRIRACDPIRHYCEYGWFEMRNPSPAFNTNYYLLNNSDVSLSGQNPFVHYILFGRAEGRHCSESNASNLISSSEVDQLEFPTESENITDIQNNIETVTISMVEEHNNSLISNETFPESQEIDEIVILVNTTIEEKENVYPISFDKNNILVMDYRIPRSDISAGEQATFGLLYDLFVFGFNVFFLPNDMEPSSEYAELLTNFGVNVITRNNGFSTSSDFIAVHGDAFPLFYLIRVDVAESVIDTIRSVAPNAKIIFHAPDVYFIREGREAELRNDASLKEKAEAMKFRELSMMNQVHHNIIVSSAELPILRQYLPNKPVSVFQVLHVSVNNKPSPFNSRRDIFFLGGFGHSPNIDAVNWFVSEIWPLIHRELPKVTFHIVGSEVPQTVKDLESVPGVVVIGYLKNLDPILSYMRLSVAPLRYGAGIKGKVATTMGAGIPVICTNIAAEGMYISDGFHTRVADNITAFAKAVVQTYKDKKQWEKFSKNGRALVQQHFSKEANRLSLLSVLNEARVLPIDLFISYIWNLPPQEIPPLQEVNAPIEISIIIPVYNQWHFTKACINSILLTTHGENIRYEIILADDGSTDETINASEYFKVIRIIKTPHNLGFLRNCNNAVQHAKGKYILLLNNDTVVLPGWLSELHKTIEEDDTSAIVGSKFLYPDGLIQEAGGLLLENGTGYNAGRGSDRDTPVFNISRETDYISGASILIRKSFWDEVGGFDERYKNAYCEDSDLAMTARSLGYRVIYQPKSEVVHFEHQSYAEQAPSHDTTLQKHNINILIDKWAEIFKRDHLAYAPWHRAMSNAERTTDLATLKRRRSGHLNILYFSPIPSHPGKHGNQATIQNFGSSFQKLGHTVHFAYLQSLDSIESDDNQMSSFWESVNPIPNTLQLVANGETIPFDGWYEEGLGEKMRILCAEYDIDVVFCSYIFQSKLLEYIPSHILKVIDTHDKMGNRYEMLRTNGLPLEFFSCSPEEEGAYLRRADVVVARRKEEADYFDSVTGTISSIIIPHVEEPKYIEKNFNSLNNIGIIASANRINLTIIQNFILTVDKYINHDDNYPFTINIVGQIEDIINRMPRDESILFQKPYIKFHGYVEDLDNFYNELDLVISPITMGTGINVKTVQAMAYGMPLLTTAWGAKGIESDDPQHSHTDLDSLVANIFYIFKNPQELNRLAQISRDRYKSFYDISISKMIELFTHEKIWKTNFNLFPELHPIEQINISHSTPKQVFDNRQIIEDQLLKSKSYYLKNNSDIRVLKGVCYLCGSVEMTFSNQYGLQDGNNGYKINWREHLVCPICNFNNRLRATVHILHKYSSINKFEPVYLTEQNTYLYSFLRSFVFPSLIGSEFLGSLCPLGQTMDGIRNEDMTNLSFSDNIFAGVLSFDVLEHIPNYIEAMQETLRCLQPGGQFIFTAPFNHESPDTLIRAKLDDNGNVIHLLPPEYHGDPLDPEKGILCFQTFGWDILDTLKDIGFENVKVLDYWSDKYAYLGGCLLFVANKPKC